MRLDGGDGRFLDFVLSGGVANKVNLMEIKTPKTKFLRSKYRKNAFAVSAALSGSIIQINGYALALRENVSVVKNAWLAVFISSADNYS